MSLAKESIGLWGVYTNQGELIVTDNQIDLRVFIKASAEEKRRSLWSIQPRIDAFPDQMLQALVVFALDDANPLIRGEACYLVKRWVSVDKQKAARFEPWIRRISHKDDTSWVREEAAVVIGKLAIIAGSTVDLELFAEARTDRKKNVLQRIQQQIDEFDNDTLQAVVNLAIQDLDPGIREQACQLVETWSEVNKQKAAQFEPQLRGMSQFDSDHWVREQAANAAEKLAIIGENTIDLKLFATADVSRRMQVLQDVSQSKHEFDDQAVQALVDYALHDPDPAIRGTASQLLREWTNTGVGQWTRFEPQVRRMAFHDPNLWVRKQAVAVAQKLYWPAFIRVRGRFALLCIAVGAFLSLVAFLSRGTVLSAAVSVPVLSCANPYAQFVVEAIGAENEHEAVDAPDGGYASIGLAADSVLILDMGQDNLIITGPGIDLYYYERPNGPGIFLDEVRISVGQDDGSDNPDPDSFIVVFVWGDDDPANNGTIPLEYFEEDEEPNTPINSEDLYNGTGIGIDIGGPDGIAYRFVRIQRFPPDEPALTPELLAEVDAFEKVCPTPTPTPFLTVTPTPTATATSTLTPTLTATLSPTPSLTTTPTPSATATITPTATPTSTATSTPTPSSTPSQTLMPTPGGPTDTPAPTPSMTATPTPSATPTVTFISTPSSTPSQTPTPTPGGSTDTPTPTPSMTATPTPSATPTNTPTATPTPMASTTPTNTPTPTSTATPSATPSPTTTPTTTSTPTPAPTQSQTATPTPSATPTSTSTPTPSATATNTPKPTATFTLTPSPTPSATPTNTPTRTATPSLIPSPTATLPLSVIATNTPTATPSPMATSTPSPSPTLSPTAATTPSTRLTKTPIATVN